MKSAIFSFHSELIRRLFPWLCHEVLINGNLKWMKGSDCGVLRNFPGRAKLKRMQTFVVEGVEWIRLRMESSGWLLWRQWRISKAVSSWATKWPLTLAPWTWKFAAMACWDNASCHGTRRLITIYTKTRSWVLSWLTFIYSANILVSSHPFLGVPTLLELFRSKIMSFVSHSGLNFVKSRISRRLWCSRSSILIFCGWNCALA